MNPSSPYAVVAEFEYQVAKYTGAPFAVAVSSCTMALLLVCSYLKVKEVTIPKYTYVSVPQSIIHAGGVVKFDDRTWLGGYQLKPYPIWDFARLFTSKMYQAGEYQCLSFHWKKTLAIGQGGAILTDNKEAYEWFKKARFNGRTAGVEPKNDTFPILGWAANMMPRDAAEGLSRLAVLSEYNDPRPNDDYLDLSTVDWNNL